MPLYYLHVTEDSRIAEDQEGSELDSVSCAVELAIASAQEIMADSLRGGRPLGLGRRILIEDQDHQTVATVTFAQALPREE